MVTKAYCPVLGDDFVNYRTTTLKQQGEETMADRRVAKSGKNGGGNITKLCNSGEWWSPRRKADAISDIENRTHRYYVNAAGYETDVTVVTRADGTKYLRTTADKASKNNLDNLPDC